MLSVFVLIVVAPSSIPEKRFITLIPDCKTMPLPKNLGSFSPSDVIGIKMTIKNLN
jgi:hypothetical protein